MWNTGHSPITDSKQLDRDPRLFMGFLTLVVLFMYVMSLISNPDIRKPGILVIFTTVIIVHLVLHWILESIAARSSLVILYILVQGVLAFTITWLSGNIGMIFGLYLGLIGEVIGLLGIRRKGILATAYFLLLSYFNYFIIAGLQSVSFWALAMIPTVIVIGLYVRMYIRQMEARTQAQALLAELETANRQLSDYAARVEDLTITSERQRMARELHDTLSQGLAGLILQLEAVDAHLQNNHITRARTIIGETMERARSTLADARRVIDNLRQTGILDLENMIRTEVEHFGAATGIACDLKIKIPRVLPDEIVETTSRVVSEALTNIARHAQASEVKLAIDVIKAGEEKERLTLEISDNGVGFDPSLTDVGHYGLLGMSERVRLAKGGVEVRSAPGTGTRIDIWLPLEENAGS